MQRDLALMTKVAVALMGTEKALDLVEEAVEDTKSIRPSKSIEPPILCRRHITLHFTEEF